MTRCCSSFSNCSPEPAAVNIVINQFMINEDNLNFRVERLLGSNKIAANVCDPNYPAALGDGVVPRYYFILDEAAVHPHSVSLRLAGTVDQRPLVGQGLTGAINEDVQLDGETPDFVVSGNLLFVTFEIADDDVLYVKYMGTPA